MPELPSLLSYIRNTPFYSQIKFIRESQKTVMLCRVGISVELSLVGRVSIYILLVKLTVV